MKYLFHFFFWLQLSTVFAVPVVTSLSPVAGPTQGVVPVTISGSGFTGATQVLFGNRIFLPGDFTVFGDSTIIVNDVNLPVATTPFSTVLGSVPGAVSVKVDAGGLSPDNNHDNFYTYQRDWLCFVPDFNGTNLGRVGGAGAGDVKVIDTGTEGVITSIPTGSGSNDVGITADGSIAYVINSGDNNISVIDVSTLTKITDVSLPGASFPIAIAITPDGTIAYTADYNNANVTPLDLTNPAAPVPGSEIGVGTRPTNVAITPDGGYLYVANSGSATLSIIPVGTTTVTTFPAAPDPRIQQPTWIAFTPDGTQGFFTDDTNGSLVQFTSLNTTPVIGTVIPGFSMSFPNFFPQVFVLPNGTKAAVSNTSSSSVALVDTTSYTIDSTIPVGQVPNGIFATPDSNKAYVSDGMSDDATILNLVNMSVSGLIPVGHTPTDPAVTPDQAPLANFTFTIGAGASVTFTAATDSPTGEIARWDWDFGDGNTATTFAPINTIEHTYALAGNYNVTLVVTNTAGTSTKQVFTGPMMSNNGDPSIATLILPIVILLPEPPTDPVVCQIADRYVTATCYNNTISWSPPVGGSDPVSYRVYANPGLTDLLFEVPANGPLTYSTCSTKAHTTYYIVAVDALGNKSTPLIVTT